MTDTREKLSSTSIGLHWVIGIAMICMVLFGLYIAGLHCGDGDTACKSSKGDLTALHKSFGILILVFASWRFLRRLLIGMLAPVGDYASWERILSKVVAWFLLLTTLALPLSGIVMTIAAAKPIAVFGVQVVPQFLAERDKALGGIAHQTHEWLGWALLAAVTLHILGALKHHVIDRDATLKRMLGARVDPVQQA